MSFFIPGLLGPWAPSCNVLSKAFAKSSSAPSSNTLHVDVYRQAHASLYNVFVRCLGARQSPGGLQCPLGRPLGLPAWPPVLLAWPSGLAWASVLPFLAGRMTVGRQSDANWTPSERQVGLAKRLPVSTYALSTPKQLPSPTKRLANSTFVAV